MVLKNGNPQHKLTVDEQRKGGKNSVKSKAEKKTNQEIVKFILDMPCSTFPSTKKLAEKNNLELDTSLKELFNTVCILNTVKKGTIDDIDKLSGLLGEVTEYGDANGNVKDVLVAIKEAAYADRDKP